MHTDSFIAYKKTKGVYSDIAKDGETIFGYSNYELDKPLPKGKNQWGKVIQLMKDELSGKITTEFAALRPKTYINIKNTINVLKVKSILYLLKKLTRFH